MEWITAALAADVMGTPAWTWVVFFTTVLALLVLDLGVLQRRMAAIGVRQSLLLSAFYISAGLLFGAWIWFGCARAGQPTITARHVLPGDRTDIRRAAVAEALAMLAARL